MATLDVLTYGFALNTDQGSFGYSTNSLLRVGSHNILIDTGPSSGAHSSTGHLPTWD